jgi:hypothetical protein
MSKAKVTREDAMHWANEHRCAGSSRSAPGWSAKTSEITGASEESGWRAVRAWLVQVDQCGGRWCSVLEQRRVVGGR